MKLTPGRHLLESQMVLKHFFSYQKYPIVSYFFYWICHLDLVLRRLLWKTKYKIFWLKKLSNLFGKKHLNWNFAFNYLVFDTEDQFFQLSAGIKFREQILRHFLGKVKKRFCILRSKLIVQKTWMWLWNRFLQVT